MKAIFFIGPQCMNYPVESVLPELEEALRTSSSAVLTAAPGAGKTTLVPGHLLKHLFPDSGKILMLEPRRIAARASARRIAALMGTAVGDLVGYRTRMDTKVSGNTRIEIVTEGILTRMLQADPALEGVNLVIFDEFHERSIHADLALALTRESVKLFRPDLKILVMSATMDAEKISGLLDHAPVIVSEGKMFPVETRYMPRRPEIPLENSVLTAAAEALDSTEGDVLVFLPGEGEIRRCMKRNPFPEELCSVCPLYGSLSPEEQDKALAPDPRGRRKLIFSSPVAETSLTIPGITAVVDSGLVRVPKFSPRNGMSRLETETVSLASADQRRGRAGRVGPGLCLRLWSREEEGRMHPFGTPAILESDLAPLRLELAVWGAGKDEIPALDWMDVPPASKLTQAETLLQELGALDPRGSVTKHGEKMSRLPLHPRLAHAVIRSEELFHGGMTACCLAALLEERAPLPEGGCDIRPALSRLHSGECDPLFRRIREEAKQTASAAGISPHASADQEKAGLILALAYPDRIGLCRAPGSGEYLLSNGTGARLRKTDPLITSEMVAAADVEGEGTKQVIFTASAVTMEDLRQWLPERFSETYHTGWNSREKLLTAERRSMLGEIILSSRPAPDDLPPEKLAEGFLAGLRTEGIGILGFDKPEELFRARVNFLHKFLPEENFPDLSDDGVMDLLEQWLLPYISGFTRASRLREVPMKQALESLLTRRQKQLLETEAPERLRVPSSSLIRVNYDTADGIPLLPVKLQEIFGMTDTPVLAEGRVPVVMEILSPALRPVQITRDLRGFWTGSYQLVRKDMRGRYPKHNWPEDPLSAVPSRDTRKK